MIVKLLLSHTNGLRQFETTELEAILQQRNSCQEKRPQLRLPTLDAAAERKILLARRTKLEDNLVAQTSHVVKGSVNGFTEGQSALDRTFLISCHRFPGKLRQQSQVGNKCPLHLDRGGGAPYLGKYEPHHEQPQQDANDAVPCPREPGMHRELRHVDEVESQSDLQSEV